MTRPYWSPVDVMTTDVHGRVLLKRCACTSTSSGPRAYADTRSPFFTRIRFADMACDACGEPWTPGPLKRAP